MKILSAEQVRQADQFTITHEPIASIDLMERAAQTCVDWILQHFQNDSSTSSRATAILCGIGNNGGDGLAIGRLLAEAGWSTHIYICGESIKGSPDFKVNLERLQSVSSVEINSISASDKIELPEVDCFIDALFGTGLNRPISENYAPLIRSLNESRVPVIAIDLPSGLRADEALGEKDLVIHADMVLTFQVPKFSLLLAEHAEVVGNFQVLDIGLMPEAMAGMQTNYHFATHQLATQLRKKRPKFSHKGTFGHSLIIGGSKGMWGAPRMTAEAALRAGAGLVTVSTGAGGVDSLHSQLPEVMVLPDEWSDGVSSLPKLDKYNCIVIGPGLGRANQSEQVLKSLIQTSQVPLVIDADALNMLAENLTWMAFLPKGSVLTPHPGEFARMIGRKCTHQEAIEAQRELSRKHGVYIVLKGAHSTTSFPDGHVWFNSSGNPGMASAGMGDTLTGIIGGLMAAGYSSGEASIFGVYLHGLAGDIALTDQSYESLLATDVIAHIGKAFQSIGYENE